MNRIPRRETRSAQFRILHHKPLLILDVGPWDKHFTVTNDAEGVILQLRYRNLIPRTGEAVVRYIDSAGVLDRLMVKDGQFTRFAPGPEWTEDEIVSLPAVYLEREDPKREAHVRNARTR